jgi:hypothetical protein
VKPESTSDSRAPDRTKPLNLTIGARGHLSEPNILMKVGQDIYTAADEYHLYNKLIEKYTLGVKVFNWS